MKIFKQTGTIPALALALSAGAASAASVTPDIIFGTGNANGSFTKTDTGLSFPSNPISGNLELGLRAKLRYDTQTSGCNPVGFGCPQNTFNWDGTDTYSFNLANGNPPSNRAMWNFEWSVNVEDLKNNGNQVTIPGLVGSGAELILSYDTDPGAGTTFVDYNLFGYDAYYGTNATANGDGTYVNVFGGGTIPAGSTVAQNSVNYGFIPGAPLGAGIFDVKMTAYSFGGAELASTNMTVNVSPVPVPAALPLLLTAFGGLGFVARRRRKAA